MKKYLAPLFALSLVSGSALAQDNSALLDLLVKKKVITAKDADNVRVELDHQQADTGDNKLKLADSVTQLALGGDFRLRYQYNRLDHQLPTNAANADQQSRWRFRLRLNADVQLGPNFFAGITLATGQAADTNNQTFDNGFNNSNIYINRAFLGWKAADWLTITAGKQDNPFYTTDLVWDPDIRPSGLVEVVRFDKMFGAAEETSTVTDKDGKSVVTSKPSAPKWTLALNSAQLIYSDNNEFNFNNNASDACIFGEQLVGSYNFGPAKVTFAPTVYFYNAASLTGITASVPFQDGPGVSGATRKMTILTAPGDVSFKIGNVPAKLYWDFAYNTQGKGRADDIYQTLAVQKDGTLRSTHKTQDDIAWLGGILVGQNKKAGDLSFLVNYRQTGITAVDPNLNDSDFALSELNTQGFKTSLFYNLTDSLTAGVSYYYAFNLRKDLFQGQATNGQKLADGNNIQVLQVDVMLKF